MQFNRNRLPTLSLTRVGMAVAIVGGAFFFGGCSSIGVPQNLDSIVSFAPAPVIVAKGHELHAAELAAQQVQGAQAFIGAGESMEPVYASGTAIVVTPVDFAQLKPGMSVVYVNNAGRGVAHALVAKTSDGWIAQGANNSSPDPDRVTVRNLVGVVTQAYAAADTPLRREIAARAMSKMATASGLTEQVTLNLSRASTGSILLASQ
ncbi:MAG: hypothetical protein ABI222_10945 [Opitutaceae bacterium]